MDQQLLAALRALTYADFEVVFGKNHKAKLIFDRYQEARTTNELQLFLLSLTNDQQADLSRYLKVIVSEQPAQVHGTYTQLHQMCSWLYQNALPFFIEILDVPQMTNGADFAVVLSVSDYQQYSNARHVHTA